MMCLTEVIIVAGTTNLHRSAHKYAFCEVPLSGWSVVVLEGKKCNLTNYIITEGHMFLIGPTDEQLYSLGKC